MLGEYLRTQGPLNSLLKQHIMTVHFIVHITKQQNIAPQKSLMFKFLTLPKANIKVTKYDKKPNVE